MFQDNSGLLSVLEQNVNIYISMNFVFLLSTSTLSFTQTYINKIHNLRMNNTLQVMPYFQKKHNKLCIIVNTMKIIGMS